MIELSCDLGEAESPEDIAVENEIWTMINAANVACGGHAGDEASMRIAARTAVSRGIVLGAHPSYPDRPNFGRVSLSIDTETLVRSLAAQIGALRDIAREEGATLQRVKAHGALYNDAHADSSRAHAIVEAIRRIDPAIAVVASDSSRTAAIARAHGMHVLREAFGDRRYMPDGSLVSRKEKDALLSIEEAATQALQLASENMVTARDGKRVRIAFETLCIHADMEGSPDRLRAIRSALGTAGYL